MTTLRELPSIDRLLSSPATAELQQRHGKGQIKSALQEMLSRWRAAGQAPSWAADPLNYAKAIRSQLTDSAYQTYVRVHNLTGTIIHTNLGRTPISAEAWHAVEPLVTGAVNLEFNLNTGKRGQREGAIGERLKALTGAESATVVNNNAAALVLLLNTLALNKQVPVSRGELIEIGGSFRLPAIMERAGCKLVEVGTTNRTRGNDFQQAINSNTAMLLRVHPSNFYIEGFTGQTTEAEMVAIAQAAHLPYCVDLGAGSLVDLTRLGLPREPTPMDSLQLGANLVTFSGDKLLGGVQSGILVGDKDIIDRLNANPLKRALRMDKISLALLDATLALYEDPESLTDKLPLLRILTTSESTLTKRAEQVQTILQNQLPNFTFRVTPSACQIGSGALPDKTISSVAVTASTANTRGLEGLLRALRELPTPIIGRIHQNQLWLDMRCAEDMAHVCTTLAQLEPIP